MNGVGRGERLVALPIDPFLPGQSCHSNQSFHRKDQLAMASWPRRVARQGSQASLPFLASNGRHAAWQVEKKRFSFLFLAKQWATRKESLSRQVSPAFLSFRVAPHSPKKELIGSWRLFERRTNPFLHWLPWMAAIQYQCQHQSINQGRHPSTKD